MIRRLSLWSSTVLACATLSTSCDQDADPTGEPIQEASEAVQPTTVDSAAETTTGMRPSDTPGAEQDASSEEAEADLEAAEGEDIDGDVKLTSTATGVRIVAEVENGKPGKHGFHIHEKGDCSDIKGKSMGGHFNPQNKPHALPAEDAERHLGDLGNIELDQDGNGRLEITMEGATLKPNDKVSFLGKAVVIHAGVDAGKAKQPSGDSGTPIACGVIEKS